MSRVRHMTGLLIDLWPSIWRTTMLPIVLVGLWTFYGAALPALAVAVVAAISLAARWRGVGVLSELACRFHRIADDRVVLYYDPALHRRCDFPEILQSCQTALNDLREQFGFPLNRRTLVFLFATWRDISHIFGKQYGGTALAYANAIFVAKDNYVQEAIRHELTHLFAAKWNLFAMPLLNEGLATWLQGTAWGRPIDSVARQLLEHGGPELTALLDQRFFFSERHLHSCYILAGSFTGFLIRRHGWARYRKFFRLANAWQTRVQRFEAAFEKCFGKPLKKAEKQWRVEVLVMEVLRRRLERELCS